MYGGNFYNLRTVFKNFSLGMAISSFIFTPVAVSSFYIHHKDVMFIKNK